MTLSELLPPEVYPIWSPYASYQAADALMKAYTEDEATQVSDIEMPVSEASPTVQGTEE